MRLTFDESPVPMVRLAWRDGRAEVLDANRSAVDLLEVSAGDLVLPRTGPFYSSPRTRYRLSPSTVNATATKSRGAVGFAATVRCVGRGDRDSCRHNNKSHHTDNEQVRSAAALVVLEDISARRVAE